MHNEKLHVRIQDLEEKIIQLLKHHKAQQEMIQKLREEKEQLIQELTNRAKIPSKNLAPGTDTTSKHMVKDWEAEIDNYISDVDKIITYFEHL